MKRGGKGKRKKKREPRHTLSAFFLFSEGGESDEN
jgi:hypothetical protein